MNLGTFRLVAKPFMQMFSIHAFIRKGKELKQVPLMFVLMTSRKFKDYKKVFEKARIIHQKLYTTRSTKNSNLSLQVQELTGPMSVDEFVSDFEKGIWRGIEEVFPNNDMIGCAFHLKQAIYRRL